VVVVHIMDRGFGVNGRSGTVSALNNGAIYKVISRILL